MPVLETRQLTLAYDEAAVIANLDLAIPAGRITALVGRNGCGKSTLLRALARLMKPRGGAVYLDNAAISKLSTKEVAKRLGILPQGPVAPEGITVRDLVAQGRYPHQSWLQQWSVEDERMVTQALALTGMADLADRSVDTLSGGQRQKAWIAMALAQGTSLLLLDEPTTFLDIAHQFEVLQLLQKLNAEEGRTIVIVIHDLNHAARFTHHMVMIDEGKVIIEGAPPEVMTPAMIRQVFEVEAEVLTDPRTGVPLFLPYSLADRHDE